MKEKSSFFQSYCIEKRGILVVNSELATFSLVANVLDIIEIVTIALNLAAMSNSLLRDCLNFLQRQSEFEMARRLFDEFSETFQAEEKFWRDTLTSMSISNHGIWTKKIDDMFGRGFGP